MYTRFKSQKSGIKLGINTISNKSHSRVLIPSISTTVTLNNDLSNTSSLIKSTASIIINETISNNNTNSVNDEIFHKEPSDEFLNKKDEEVNINKKDSHNTCLNYNQSNSCYNKNSKNLNSINSNYSNEESIDPNCISYVKSTWEKYVNEIGKKDGPLRHEDDSSQYPHLNGFVPFDMEHWWAERSISKMINEKPDTNIKDPENKYTTRCQNNLINQIKKIDQTNEISANKSTNLKLSTSYSSAILAAAAAAAVSTSAYNKKPSSPPPLQNFNNFQLCFS